MDAQAAQSTRCSSLGAVAPHDNEQDTAPPHSASPVHRKESVCASILTSVIQKIAPSEHSYSGFAAAIVRAQLLHYSKTPETIQRTLVAIHDQVLLPVEKTIFTVGQLAGHLFHPDFVWTGGAASKVNSASFQFHDEQKIKRH